MVIQYGRQRWLTIHCLYFLFKLCMFWVGTVCTSTEVKLKGNTHKQTYLYTYIEVDSS